MKYDLDKINIKTKEEHNILKCLLESRVVSALKRPTLASIGGKRYKGITIAQSAHSGAVGLIRYKWTSYKNYEILVESLKNAIHKPHEVIINIDGKKLNYETPEKKYLKIYKYIKEIIPLCDVLHFRHEEDDFNCKYFIQFIEQLSEPEALLQDLNETERILLKYFDDASRRALRADGKTVLNEIFTPMIMEILPNKVHISAQSARIYM